MVVVGEEGDGELKEGFTEDVRELCGEFDDVAFHSYLSPSYIL